MLVHWLTAENISSQIEAQCSNLASVRLRLGSLLEYTSTKVGVPLSVSFGRNINPKADTIIVGKVGADAELQSKWISQLAEVSGKKSIVIDYTDHHIREGSSMRRFYQKTLSMSRLVVCSSAQLERWVRESGFPNTVIIPDAIEVSIVPPKEWIHSPLTCLWFGHATNVPALVDTLSNNSFQKYVKRLLVVSDPQGLQHFQANTSAKNPVECLGALWSLKTLKEAATAADLCIIPFRKHDTIKSGASSNRLLTAFALGLPTAATSIDSYLEFKGFFAELDTDEFNELATSPIKSLEKIREFQTQILPRYQKYEIGTLWSSTLSKLP